MNERSDNVGEESAARMSPRERHEKMLQDARSKGDSGIDLREQVDRVKQASDRSLPSGELEGEENWGQKKASGQGVPSSVWFLIALGVPLFVIVLFLVDRGIRSLKGAGGNELLELSSGHSASKDDPLRFFLESDTQVYKQAEEILETLSEPELAIGDLKGIVLNEGQAQWVLERQKENSWPGFTMPPEAKIQWKIASIDDLGFLEGKGTRKNFKDFTYLFVEKEGRLVVDVFGSEAYSPTSIAEISEKSPRGEFQLRCWIAKEPDYDARSNAKEFSWFLLESPSKHDVVWAFCGAKGEIDEGLREVLNYGRVIGERKSRFRGIVTIRSSNQFSSSEYEIVSYDAEGWVHPDDVAGAGE